jgi:hypothetical protein
MNKGGGSTGIHIHNCITRVQEKQAQELLESQYSPRTCDWKPCKLSSKVWASRKDFTSHLRLHLDRFLLPRLSLRLCQWELDSGDLCEEDEWEDIDKHFAEAHAINTAETVEVKYCCICAEWSVSLDAYVIQHLILFQDLGPLWRWRSVVTTLSRSFCRPLLTFQ